MAFPGSQTSRRQQPRAGFSEEGGRKEGKRDGGGEGGREVVLLCQQGGGEVSRGESDRT